MMRPPLPCSRNMRARRLVEKERRLEIDVVLDVPVGLADLVDAVAADEHGGRADQDVEAAEGVGDRVEQRGLCPPTGRDRAPMATMRPALHLRDDRIDRRLTEIDDARPARRPRRRRAPTSRPMPPAAPVRSTRLALEAGPSSNGMSVLLVSRFVCLAWRPQATVCSVDEAGLRLAR